MIQGYLVSAMLKDLLRVQRVIGWLILMLALFALGKVYVSVNGGAAPVDAYNQLSSMIVYRVLMLSAAILSAAVLAQEVEQKTIVYLVTRPIPRANLIASRMTATFLVVAGIALVSALAMSFAVFGADALRNEHLWRDTKGLTAGAAAYTVLFTLTSLMVNRSMLINLVFAFGWETATVNMSGNIYKLSVFTYLKAIAEKPSSHGALGILTGDRTAETISVMTGWVTVIALVAICGYACLWWFQNFAYLPREDAE